MELTLELLGEYEYNIDQKCRLVVPAKFREAFRDGLILTLGFEKCLVAYPRGEWRKMAERLAALPPTRSSSRRVNRNFFSNAFPLELDRQGRVVLPPALREYAQIKEGVVIAGVYSYLEIWSQELWEKEKALMREQAATTAEEVLLTP